MVQLLLPILSVSLVNIFSKGFPKKVYQGFQNAKHRDMNIDQ